MKNEESKMSAAEYRKTAPKGKGFYSLGRLKNGEMNKLEMKYSKHLESLQLAGEILWWKFDCLNLRLADGCFYKPDFMVLTKDNELQIHEVKGVWQDDARVKIKVAANSFPFVFIAIQWAKGAWKVEEF